MPEPPTDPAAGAPRFVAADVADPAAGTAPQPPTAASGPVTRPPLWTRDFLLLLGITVTFYTGFQILLASMPLYVVHLGGTEASAGLVTGLFTLAAMLARPLTGWALDAYGRRAVLLFGTIFCLALIVAQDWAATLGALIVLRMVNGFGFGFATTAGGALAADLVPRSRLGEGMGLYALTMGIPLGIAPPVGIWLAGRGQFSALFWLATLVTGVSLVLALIIRVPRQAVVRAVGARAHIFSMFVRSAVFPSALMFLLISSLGVILALLAIFGRERGIASVGAWFTLYAVMLSLSRVVSGRVSDRLGYAQTAAVGFGFAVVGLMLMASAHSSWVLLASAVLFGIGYGAAQPSLQAMLVARTPPHRIGSATAFFFFAYDLGTTVGAVGGGFLAGVIGLGNVFALAAVPPFIALILLVARLGRGRAPAGAGV
ncbi:MAG: MFS transporter [Actinobacteria bacterium]|nr:MFS transporter [Actinomycetota bacterium]